AATKGASLRNGVSKTEVTRRQKPGERTRPGCWFRRLAETNFLTRRCSKNPRVRKVRDGETPSPAPGTGALPRGAGRDLVAPGKSTQRAETFRVSTAETQRRMARQRFGVRRCIRRFGNEPRA